MRRNAELLATVFLLLLALPMWYWLGDRSPREGAGPTQVEPARLRQVPCAALASSTLTLSCFEYTTRSPLEHRLSVAVMSDSQPGKADPLVYLAGGPGEGQNTGRQGLEYWQHRYWQLAPGRDLVVADMRGNAPGKPAWDCQAYGKHSVRLLAEDLSFAEEAERLAPVTKDCIATFAKRLLAHTKPTASFETHRPTETDFFTSGDLMRQFASTENARDMADLLTALGYTQWNILGVSYGTRVAQIMAQRYPQVRRVILDSPYPLGTGDMVGNLRQWVRAFEVYFRNCNEGVSCPPSAHESERLFWRLMARLDRQPLALKVEDWRHKRDIDWVLNDYRLALVVHDALYTAQSRAQVYPALQALENGELAPINDLVEHLYNRAFDSAFNAMVYIATECSDNAPVAEVEFADALNGAGPWRRYLASDWHYHVCHRPEFRSGALPPAKTIEVPVLVLSGEFDPVTPASYQDLLKPYLRNGIFYTVPGAGHTEFFARDCASFLLDWFLNADRITPAIWRAQLQTCDSA